MRQLARVALLTLLGGALAAPALATGTSAVTVVPAPDNLGERQTPFSRSPTLLVQDYVEDEFFVSGTADIYTYDDPPVRGEVIVQPVNATFPQTVGVPYTTRILVRRPVDPAEFTGTVVIEWMNSTAGFDTTPVWDPMAEFAGREGWVWVGFTNSTTSIAFLKAGCTLFGFVQVADCQTRYSALDMSENGLAWDMGSQLANVIRDSANPNNPLPPAYAVERLYHAGQSQQGGSMVTYASAFHQPANDGYFVQAAHTARPINFGEDCAAAGAPAYPECTPRLSGSDRLVATDLPVPVMRALTETDVGGALANGTRQSDTATFRYYEIAGATHVTVHKGVEVVPGIRIEDFCLNEMNTLADGQVLGSFPQRAMWKSLDEFVRNGTPMLPGVVLATTAQNEIARGPLGNASGGVRTTDMDAPIATYTPNNTFDPTLPPALHGIAQLACVLSGSVARFGPGILNFLYPTPEAYVAAVKASADTLVASGFLLPEDREIVLLRALLQNPKCGLGFELALVLPPLMWLRGRRKRAR